MSYKMASRIFLLCLLVSLLTVSYIECRGHSSGHSSSHSSGHSSSHSSGHSSGGSHSWGHSGSSSSHSYPSSSSGLSGSGTHGSSSHGSGSHSYPSGTGLSGSHSYSNNNNYNHRTFNRNSGHYTTHYGTSNVHYAAPSYYTSPEYGYIREYRHSNSRYGDLLTGLSLYNYGRSQSYYHDHYYYDDYYRRRYDNSKSTSPYYEENKPQDSANCVLKVKDNGRVEVLHIPCEIVSTFTEGSKKATPSQQTQVNKTVCTSTITKINNTVSSVPAAAVTPTVSRSQMNSANTASFDKTERVSVSDSSDIGSPSGNLKSYYFDNLNAALESVKSMNRADTYTEKRVIPQINFTMPNFAYSMPNFDLNAESLTLATNSNMQPMNSTMSSTITTSSGSVTTTTVTTVNATMVNVTVCTTNTTFVDPLTLQGPPVNLKNMQCVVEIHTRDAFLSNVIDCNTLVEYAKLPEPKKDTGMLPERQKLKSWLAKPPWWMSLFIAV